jgi:hypothetical protein
MHLNHILTENDLFKLSKRQLIQPEANKIRKQGK